MRATLGVVCVIVLSYIAGIVGLRWWWKYVRMSQQERRRIAPGRSGYEYYIRHPFYFLLMGVGGLGSATYFLVEIVRG